MNGLLKVSTILAKNFPTTTLVRQIFSYIIFLYYNLRKNKTRPHDFESMQLYYYISLNGQLLFIACEGNNKFSKTMECQCSNLNNTVLIYGFGRV